MTEPASEADVTRPPDVRWAVVVGAVLVLPLLVAAVIIATGDAPYHPGFDNALIELRTRDALDHVLYTGPYSRFGWYHPGPILFYLYAVPYRILGERSLVIPVVALVINAAMVAVLVWLGFRIARLPGVLWVALPTALLMRSFGIALLHSQWNPDVSTLAFLAFLVAAWAIAVGQRSIVLVAVALGTFVVQNHVGDALPVVLILGLGLAFGERWRPQAPGRRARVYGAAAVLALVLWALPIYGDVVAGNGNLRKVASFALSGGTSSTEARAGGLEALKVVGAQWGPRPLWLVTSTADLPFDGALVYEESRWWLPLAGLPVAAFTLWGFVKRRREVATAGAITAVGFGAALFSVASVKGAVWSYLAWWIWALGAFSAMAILAGVWSVLRRQWHRVARPFLLVVTLGVSAAVGVGFVADAAQARTPSDTAGLTVAEQQASGGTISREVIAAIPRQGREPVVLDTTYGVLESPGLALALERAGLPVRVLGLESSVPYGPEREWHCGVSRARLRIYSGDDNIKAQNPVGRRIARWVEQYSPVERRRQNLTRAAFLAQPPSAVRTRVLARAESELNGPKYLVEVYDDGRVDEPCRP